MTPTECLDRLVLGNDRYVKDQNQCANRGGETLCEQLRQGQDPFAVVVGCSDSRVPVEVVFDQSPGDLFVIRVAGNIIESSQEGSLDFAVNYLACKLIVVLGHTQCGAVKATLAAQHEGFSSFQKGLREILESVQPAVSGLQEHEVEEGIEKNVRQSMQKIKEGPCRSLIKSGEVAVVGAVYQLESGMVSWLKD